MPREGAWLNLSADSTVRSRVMAMPGGFMHARLPTPEVEAITTLVGGLCMCS